MIQADDHLPISSPVRLPAEEPAVLDESPTILLQLPASETENIQEPKTQITNLPPLHETLRTSTKRRFTKPPRHYIAEGSQPTSGIRGLIWRFGGSWLYAHFGWESLRQLSLSERNKNALDELWLLRHKQKIVTIVNSKGGSGKTTIAVWLSASLSSAIKRHVVAFDANENTGHTASRLGIQRENTIQLRKLLKQCESLDDLAKLTEVVDWHRETGVSVIASEAANNSAFSRDRFIRALSIIKQSSHAVFCDCGNGISHPANRGSVQLADTLVFPGNAASGDSLRDITNTMKQYSDPKFRMAQKVTKGVIVIVGAKESERRTYAHLYDFPVERVFAIPRNSYMAGDNIVSLGRVPLRVRVILLEILVAILRAEHVPEPDEQPGE